jgi:tetratricopeptide (TPR) repeat protein
VTGEEPEDWRAASSAKTILRVRRSRFDASVHMTLGVWIYERLGHDAEAEAPIRRALQIRPHWGTARYFLAICLLMQDPFQVALHTAEDESPQDSKFQAMSAVLLAMHRTRDSDADLGKAIKTSAVDWPSSIAKLYAFRGNSDQAIAWLERAYAFRDEDLYFVKGDPQLRALAGDPRYKAFLRKMNLPD